MQEAKILWKAVKFTEVCSYGICQILFASNLTLKLQQE